MGARSKDRFYPDLKKQEQFEFFQLLVACLTQVCISKKLRWRRLRDRDSMGHFSMIDQRWFTLAFFCFLLPVELSAQSTEIIKAGAGSYSQVLPSGAKLPPRQIFKAPNFEGKMPTNDWWSSLAWLKYSDRHFPHPLGVQAEPGGLRVFYAGANLSVNKQGVFGFSPGPGGHDLLLGHSGADQFPAAVVDKASDWHVTALFQSENNSLSVTYGHGSPYVYARTTHGNVQISFVEPPLIWSGNPTSAGLGITIGNRHYGLFGPSDTSWKGLHTKQFVCQTQRDYFSLAILPDNKPATLELFRKYSHAHVINSQVSWNYHESSGTVHTTFRWETQAMEGSEKQTLFSLYPHQWRHSTLKCLDHEYQSVRGRLKLAMGLSFETSVAFPGVLPCLPKSNTASPERMARFLSADLNATNPSLPDTYWQGKWLGRMSSQLAIAETYGQPQIAEKLLQKIRGRLEDWLNARESDGTIKSGNMFYYDNVWGTLIGFPASYGSDQELNDHHFHYGYFIRAAAEVALRDPQWAQDTRWGSMIKLLMRDVASPSRQDAMFPFLRNFDPFAGHSWASGHARFADGNNNESSSEGMNAWYGMILWGIATDDKSIRDLGLYLYTTEMTAIHEYWFDVHQENYSSDYPASVVTMVWGGKGANATWFTANPEAVHGINWLPITGGSLYLGLFPRYVARNFQALIQENQGENWDEWPDLIWMYQSLSDAGRAVEQFERGYASAKFEAGNSPANTYHWVTSLDELGQMATNSQNPNSPWISANTPMFSVFDRGSVRTYCVYSTEDKLHKVTFSDGFQLQTKSKGWTIQQQPLSRK